MALSSLEREVLIRFYDKGERAEHIQCELGLTAKQFSNIKCRAKHRFTELCEARVQQRRSHSLAVVPRMPVRHLA